MPSCAFGCGNEAKYLQRNGKWCCSKHFSKCPVIRKKHSDNFTDERKELYSIRAKENNFGESGRERMKDKDYQDRYLTPRKRTPEYRIKRSEITRRNFALGKYKNFIGCHKGEKQSKERVDNRTAKTLLWWNSLTDEEKSPYIRNKILATQKHPNRMEKFVLTLLKENVEEDWEFCGDGSTIINGKNPDYINRKRNKVIEFFGSKWHEERFGNEGIERIKIFESAGYPCFIIYENDLCDVGVLIQNLIQFNLWN